MIFRGQKLGTTEGDAITGPGVMAGHRPDETRAEVRKLIGVSKAWTARG